MKKFLVLLTGLLATSCLPSQTPLRTGKDYAVFFHVTDFPPGWASLPETAAEAEQLQTELQTGFGFACEMVANPSRQQVLDKIASYNERLTANDQVLFFFSMHGYYDGASDLGYLVAADGEANDPYYRTWLDYNSLRPYFAKCKAKHILVALDACFSGSFGQRNRSAPIQPVYTEELDCTDKIGNPFQYTGRQYVCSGNKEAKTPAKSLFADKFLEALRKGPDADGLLRFDDLTYWLGKVDSPEPESGSFTGHQPAGDFVFVRKNACGLAAEISKPAAGDPLSLDLAAWKQAKLLHTREGYEEYLQRFSNGEFADKAREIIHLLGEDAAWSIAVERNKIADYEQYIKAFPAGKYHLEANLKIGHIKNPDDGLTLIPGGTFIMGCMGDCEPDEEPARQVTVGDFYIGRYEVTQALWRSVMDKDSLSKMNRNCEQCPVENITWHEIQEFLQRLNAQTGRQYRLPTEAEWEYAARGGKLSQGYKYAGSNSINEVAWHALNANNIHTVGKKKANELGLYDMSGNVWEWCSNNVSAAGNPTASTGGGGAKRGGSFVTPPKGCRISNRSHNAPELNFRSLGFRLARSY